ncbi:MAG: HEAT repeat domain-containing protein [Blastomonas sp.]
MSDRYDPKSDFLKAVIADEERHSSNEWADMNILQLIELTGDDDQSNRDWAVFLLAQMEIDTPAIRHALLQATGDKVEVVRAEAILGLAKRDVSLALPLVQEGLRADSIVMAMLEAAAICAHPSLITDLRVWAAPSDTPFLDEIAANALAACESAERPKS